MTRGLHKRERVVGALGIGLMVCAAVAVYWPVFRAPFVFDDLTSIRDNATIRQLWPPSVPLHPPAGTGITVEGRPVLNLSFAFNYAVCGLDVRGYRVVNLAIHLACGLLLLGLVRRTFMLPGFAQSTGGRRLASLATHAAWCVSVLWLLHPLATAAVSYASRRADTLVALFLLLTLYAFVRGATSPAGLRRARCRWFACAVLASVLGMGTKETMAVAPVLVLLFDRTLISGSLAAALRRHAVVHGSLAATWLVLSALLLESGSRAGTAGFGSGISWLPYALTQAGAVTRYLVLAVWPHPLVFDYGTPIVESVVRALPQLLCIGGLVVATSRSVWKQQAGGLAAASFFLVLAPSSSVVPVATQTIAEHRMYLPLASVVVLVVATGIAFAGRRAVFALFPLAAILGVLSFDRNLDYRSELLLWSDTVAKRPENARAHDFLGRALIREGRLPEAIAAFEEAVRLEPGAAPTRSNLGSALLEAGRVDEAIIHLHEAVRLAPGSFAAQANLGNALLRSGEAEAALMPLLAADGLAPGTADVSFRLAVAHARLGDTTAAIMRFEQTLHLAPDHIEARYALANLLAQSGRRQEAIAHYEEVVRLQPEHVEALNNLGNALMLQRQPRAAIPHYEAAIALRPSAMTHSNLAMALLLTGDASRAIGHYQSALRLDPDYAPARSGLLRAERVLSGK